MRSIHWDTFEFGVYLEGLNSVDMAAALSKLVFFKIDSKVPNVADIDQVFVASPSITMNDTFDRDITASLLLQRLLACICVSTTRAAVNGDIGENDVCLSSFDYD